MIVALSALFIGLITAVISVYSAYVDRQYARSSVWPRLEIYRSYSTVEQRFSYGITNNGTGPAIIEHAKVSFDSQFIKKWADIDVLSEYQQWTINNRTLLPEQVINALVYQGDKFQAVFNADSKVKIELCYCSIYQECWTINRANKPKQVKQCLVKPEEAFED
nr:hypothetical protein [Alteromonas sp. 5E99-2]